MIADVILEQLTHQAIDGTPHGREPLEHVRARCILVEGALDRFELSHYFFGAIQQIQFFSRNVRHFSVDTLMGYGSIAELECAPSLLRKPQSIPNEA